ncbi:MAG: cellulase family glycosylhydrolase, partial [Ardenticatenaceae bacterium]
RGGSYNWGVLATFERHLLAAAGARLTPVVVLNGSPEWATVIDPDVGYTSCAAIRADRFPDFAAFMSALVTRYSLPPYNVKHWEIGNEPDVDPSLVGPTAPFGCWGDIDEPYYGGEHYGHMLNAVAPAIREADPAAKILVGGLLLNTLSPAPGFGHSERFLEGILRAGAKNNFDIVAFHGYPSYADQRVDYDLRAPKWSSHGGIIGGKASFLREVMRRYGVDKPLHLNETGLLCNEASATCSPPRADFFQAQSDFLTRSFPRGVAAGIEQLTWYTLTNGGWRYAGLLDEDGDPRPAYFAYQTLIAQVKGSDLPPQPVNYGNGVEAYRFTKPSGRMVDVV